MLRYPLTVLLISLLTSCAIHTATAGRLQLRDDQSNTVPHFSEQDRKAIEEYFRTHPVKKAVGAKAEPVTSGLAVQQVLPLGLHGRSLPHELDMRLTALPAGTRRIVLGHDVLLLQRETRRILDILYKVVP